jgi:hypothetical protein
MNSALPPMFNKMSVALAHGTADLYGNIDKASLYGVVFWYSYASYETRSLRDAPAWSSFHSAREGM